MRRLLLLLGFLLIGCGRPFVPAAQCEVPGLGTAFFEGAADCARMGALADDARETLASRGLVDMARWDAVLGQNLVWMRADNAYFDCSEARGQLMGCQWNALGGASNIELQASGGALLHELLHRWDVAGLHHSDAATAAHEGWDARGWNAADQAFMSRWVVHEVSSPG